MLNQEIPILAKKIYELSALPADELEARKWEALLILNAAYSSATTEGIEKAKAEMEARWGDKMRAEGIVARLHPKWHLRTDDGRPPVMRIVLESAMNNPYRDLRTRLQALQFIPENERGPLTDVVRAFEDECWRGAKGEARDKFLDVMRSRSKTWFKDPWLTVLPYDGNPPPVSILIENQGTTHDGGWYDDPSDDTEWEKIKFGWQEAIRTWDVSFLRDNPVSQFYLGVSNAANQAVETAADVAEGGKKAVEATAKILAWLPYIATGIAVLGVSTWAVTIARR